MFKAMGGVNQVKSAVREGDIVAIESLSTLNVGILASCNLGATRFRNLDTVQVLGKSQPT